MQEETRIKIVMGAMILIIVLLATVRFGILEILFRQNNDLTITQIQLDQIKHENIRLKEEYLYNSSYTTITQKAEKQGFVPGEFYYLK